MDISKQFAEATVAELADEFIVLGLALTDSIPAECQRLHRQNDLCVELTARCAWTEAGPHIDAAVKRARQMLRSKGRNR